MSVPVHALQYLQCLKCVGSQPVAMLWVSETCIQKHTFWRHQWALNGEVVPHHLCENLVLCWVILHWMSTTLNSRNRILTPHQLTMFSVSSSLTRYDSSLSCIPAFEQSATALPSTALSIQDNPYVAWVSLVHTVEHGLSLNVDVVGKCAA